MTALIGILLTVLSGAMLLSFARLLRGPSLADRIIALDVLTMAGVGVVVLGAMAWDEPALIDIAVVLALITFVGTIGFAKYLEKGLNR